MTPTAMSSLTGRYSYFNGGLLDWFVSWNSISAVWTAAFLYKLKKTVKLNIHALDLQAVTVSPNKMTKKEMTKDLEFMAKEIRTRVFIDNVVNVNHHVNR